MKLRTQLRRLVALLCSAVFLPLAACTSSMLETTEYDWSAGVGAQRCRSGTYYLPRRLLAFQVSNVSGSGRNTLEFVPKLDADLIPVSDPRLPLCLDYLAAPTADDKIAIDRTPDGLLKSINANAVDRSKEIAIALIDVARLSAVAAGSARSRISSKIGDPFVAKFKMDPFDVPEAAAINDALKDLGFCIYVEGYTFDPHVSSPEAYCRNPRRALRNSVPYTQPIDTEILMSEARRGVLYRPNLSHTVVVMRKLDPGGPGGWQPWQRQRVDMPNASPIFSVGVDRTYFTDRTTKLTFDFGVLKDVQIVKGSELNSIAELPLKIAQAVVSVPAQIVMVRINLTNNEEALIAAQGKLLETYRDFENERKLLAVVQQAPENQGLLRCLAEANGDVTAVSKCNQVVPPSPLPPNQ
jgi:hypothetical protein